MRCWDQELEQVVRAFSERGYLTLSIDVALDRLNGGYAWYIKMRADDGGKVCHCGLCGKAIRSARIRDHGRQHLIDLGAQRLAAFHALTGMVPAKEAVVTFFGYHPGTTATGRKFWKKLAAGVYDLESA